MSPSERVSRWRRIAAGVALLALVAAGFFLPVGEWAQALQGWADERDPLGLLWFGLACVAAVSCLAPASALTIAAGLAFGAVGGVIVVSLASTAAAALAFLVARHVALVRLSPILPFHVSDYALGLTRVGFGTCVQTSWLAMLPGTVLYVQIGALGHSGRGAPRSPLEWAFLVVGLVASVVLVVVLTRAARRRWHARGAVATRGSVAVRRSDRHKRAHTK